MTIANVSHGLSAARASVRSETPICQDSYNLSVIETHTDETDPQRMNRI
jgi:hypothetical protein